MKNLFVMHTQYNIISAVAVLEKEFSEDENDLIIIAEFPLTEAYVTRLEQIFKNVWVAQSRFDNSKGIQKLFHFWKKYRKCLAASKEHYDHVITAQEEYFDTLLVSKISEKNVKLKWYSVEEDAYYITGTHELHSSRLKKIAKNIYYTIIIPLIFGQNRLFEVHPCYGANSNIQKIFLTYPELARHEIQCKEKAELKAPELQKAVKMIYRGLSENVCVDSHSVVFFSDLFERYRNRDTIISLAEMCFLLSTEHHRRFYIKYHPRETEKIKAIPKQFELPTTLPAELILAENSEKGITIIGNQSTSVFLARKMGYRTISLVWIENPEKINEAAIFFEKIGIECITNIKAIEEDLV